MQSPLPFAAIAAWGMAVCGTLIRPRDSLAVAAVGLLIAVIARGHASRVMALGLGIALAGMSVAYHVHVVTSGTVHDLAERHADVEVIAQLVRDPQLVASSSASGLTLTDATVVAVRVDEWRAVRAPVVLLSYGPGWTGLLPGQRIEVSGRLSPPRPDDHVAAALDVRSPPTPVGSAPWWQRIAGRVRVALRRACGALPADPRGLLPSLVEGDTSEVPASLQTAMRSTGLTHLEAVSGENVSLTYVMEPSRGKREHERASRTLSAGGLSLVMWL